MSAFKYWPCQHHGLCHQRYSHTDKYGQILTNTVKYGQKLTNMEKYWPTDKQWQILSSTDITSTTGYIIKVILISNLMMGWYFGCVIIIIATAVTYSVCTYCLCRRAPGKPEEHQQWGWVPPAGRQQLGLASELFLSPCFSPCCTVLAAAFSKPCGWRRRASWQKMWRRIGNSWALLGFFLALAAHLVA